MILDYYPDTGNSLANSITMCVRAWKDKSIKSIKTEDGERPIATFIGTICGPNIMIGEVTKNLKIRLPELDKDYAESYWVPIIFYKNCIIMRITDKDIETYLRLYKIIMSEYEKNIEIAISSIENNVTIEIDDIVNSILLFHYGCNEYVGMKNTDTKFFEFVYRYQDKYLKYLKLIVDYSTKLEEEQVSNDNYFKIIINEITGNLLSEGYVDINLSTDILDIQDKQENSPSYADTTDIDHRGAGPSFPSNPYQGEYFYNTSYKKLYMYDGVRWDEIVTPVKDSIFPYYY